MKPEKLSDAIGMLDEDIITEAEESRNAPKSPRKPSKTPIWIGICSAAACAVIAGVAVLNMSRGQIPTNSVGGVSDDPVSISGDTGSIPSDLGGLPNVSVSLQPAKMLYGAEYPEMPQYPMEFDPELDYDNEVYMEKYKEWRIFRRELNADRECYTEEMSGFMNDSMELYLSEADGENVVYSPLNTYMALAVLAETSDGTGRQQILDALGADSIEALRTQANAAWECNYYNDGLTTSIPANSLWLRNDAEYDTETLGTVAENYYSSVYAGEMGSAEYDELLRDWLSEQTGGVLDASIHDVGLDPQTVLGLYSTLYFSAQWDTKFNEDMTEAGVFHTSDGDEVTVDFMKWKERDMNYFWGENFGAIPYRFEDYGTMWLLLPDEDITAEELARDDEVYELLKAEYDWENRAYSTVNFSLPKFDISCEANLIDGLRRLGITDIFDADSADFSPLSENAEGMFVSAANQAARVTVDEKGCTAATYMEIIYVGDPLPEGIVEFTLDRPFLFFITGSDSVPLFGGIVNDP